MLSYVQGHGLGSDSMRDTVYFLIFDGFADWEAALALCEIRRPGNYEVRTVGFSPASVVSMGGLRIKPDVTLADIDPLRAALMILPGGHLWERGEGEAAVVAARRLHIAGAIVAGICGATLALARAGLLDTRAHTSNLPGYIDEYVVAYAGRRLYDSTVLAAGQERVITASGVGSVEFAREIIRALNLYELADITHWYRLFKHAIPPPWFVADTAAA
jgi:putative intracellular protease/amidase